MYSWNPQQTDGAWANASPQETGVVVVHSCKSYGNPRSHESVAHDVVARRLAAIKGHEFAGEYDGSCRYPGRLYFVPGDTLIRSEFTDRLGILGEHDLFGGIVPFPFVATKTITHPLVDADARAPEGWSHDFARRVHNVVLPGFSAFTVDDARTAAVRLLDRGSVRIKKASGIGGLGQSVVSGKAELDSALQSMDADELAREGVVVEQNLESIETYSVGQACVGDLLATYCGTQRLTTNNHGVQVYGGSNLFVVRGDFDALLQLELPAEMRTAVSEAQVYHAAAMQCFSGMFASRCNYDVARGNDADGRTRSGVLEQSWRMGGASGAEIAALEAFRADPALDKVCASTTEIYGDHPAVPSDAVIYFQGVDERVGPLIKYSRLETYANP